MKSILKDANEFLSAASLLVEKGFPSVSVGRAYYAMFHAATAALLTRGIERSSHHALIAAFGRFLVKGGLIDEAHHASLREVFLMRNQTDYLASPSTNVENARKAIERAQAFVEACRRFCDREV